MSLAAVLDACADDVLLAIVIALPTPADLLRLTVICRASAQRFYFTATCFGSAAVATGCSGRAANGEYGEYGSEAVETWSIVQEAARLWLISAVTRNAAGCRAVVWRAGWGACGRWSCCAVRWCSVGGTR
jgi:hypothetical protein